MKLVKFRKAENAEVKAEVKKDTSVKKEELKITFTTYQFIQIPFVAATDGRLTPIDVRVLVCLYGMVSDDVAKYARENGTQPFCQANNTNIEKMAHVTRKPLLKALKNLKQYDYIDFDENETLNKYYDKKFILQNPSSCGVTVELEEGSRMYRKYAKELRENEGITEGEVGVKVYGKRVKTKDGDVKVIFDRAKFEVKGKVKDETQDEVQDETQELKSSADKNAKHETTHRNMKFGAKKRELKKKQKMREYDGSKKVESNEDTANFHCAISDWKV